MAQNALKRAIAPVLAGLAKHKIERSFTREPITICGCGRSGTTLLLSILDALPEVFGMDEVAMYARWEWRTGPDGAERPVPLRMDRFHRHVLLSRIPPTTTRWCEKRPLNVRVLEEILAYHEGNIRVIHLLRDGRDVLTSRHPSDPGRYWVPIDRWVRDVRAGLEFSDHPSVATVKYEDLVREPEATIRRILSFVDIEAGRPLERWHERTSIKSSDAWFGGVRTIDTSSIGKWRRDEHGERLSEIMAHREAVELLEETGYG